MINPERKRTALLRLRSMGERQGLIAEQQAAMRGRFAGLAQRGQWQDRVAVADNLFPTPPTIAARMVAALDLRNEHTVLEPSAGTGRLLDALADTGLDLSVTACETCPRLCRHLLEKYQSAKLHQGDFLWAPLAGVTFDRVVMNPPFRRSTDAKHIRHALSLLAPGGRLVALCYDGAVQNRDLKPLADTWEVLPATSFAAEGTRAGVVLLTINQHQGNPTC